MITVVVISFLLSLIALPIGLIKPSWIVRRDGISRKKFGLSMIGVVMGLAVFIGVTVPPETKPKVRGTSATTTITPSVTSAPAALGRFVGSESLTVSPTSSLTPTPKNIVTSTPESTKTPTPSLTPSPTATSTPALTVKAVKTQTPTPTKESVVVKSGTYVNVDGETIQSPIHTTNGSVPAGASAQCRDGTYSFSKNRRGTCSGHGGVSRWL